VFDVVRSVLLTIFVNASGLLGGSAARHLAKPFNEPDDRLFAGFSRTSVGPNPFADSLGRFAIGAVKRKVSLGGFELCYSSTSSA